MGYPQRKLKVWLPPLAAGTYEEAEILRDYASAHGLKSLLVVTSAYHSRRAMWAWQRVFSGSGVCVDISAVDPGMQSPRASLWWLTPMGWEMVAGEYLKFGYYLLRYW
ncbi:MAG: ElyC/SanA/YdcF family protein [Pyrinomonadaceae bacterium]